MLITGSSRGIGKAVAELAHTKGYTVILNGKTDSAALQTTHRKLDGSHKLVFDVADKAATQAAISGFIKEHGRIDVLVACAGVARNFISDIQDADDDKAIEEYRVNVLGTLHCVQAVLLTMPKGSSVITFGSIKGHPTLTTLSTLTYGPAKAAVIALTKALAKVYPDVRFNSVSPGYVRTDQVKDWNDQTFDRINNGTVMGRIAEPEEIASMVLFLASDDASYITGSDILIDGGYSIKGK